MERALNSQREIEFRRTVSSGMPMSSDVSDEDFPTPENRVDYFRNEANRLGNALDTLSDAIQEGAVYIGEIIPGARKDPIRMKDVFPIIGEENDRYLDKTDWIWLRSVSQLASLRLQVAEDALEKIKLMREAGTTGIVSTPNNLTKI